MDDLTGAEFDTLQALVLNGPLWDGDVPSKSGRDSLIDRKLAVRIVVRGEDGYTAATYAGRDLWKAQWPDPDGAPAGTMCEANLNRLTRRAIARARGAR
ncbi:MAG: hypothetical protein KA200_00210 [Burkholderiales bacterium]|nr:hypothetical protein [Burkholderiales bacterium]